MFSNYKRVMKAAELFSLKNVDLLNKVKSELNKATFFTANLSMQVLTAKSIAETLTLNFPYKESCNFFGFGCDKKYLTMLEEDKNLLAVMIKEQSDVKVSAQTLPIVLAAISLKDGIDSATGHYSDVKDAIRFTKITSTINGVMSDAYKQFKKSLKSFDKDLYNKADEIAKVHRPFEADVDNNNF